MEKLISGQRWVSETEPELGLGTLVKVTGRTITLRFDSSDCIRQYAFESAPLKRVIFKPGDEIQLQDKTCLTIKTVSESDGSSIIRMNNQRSVKQIFQISSLFHCSRTDFSPGSQMPANSLI